MALGSILQGVPEVASASQVAGGFSLGGLGSLLSGASALGSMFGGGDGASANDLAESQLYYGLLGMKHAPYAQVTGLRRAGLNPMLAVSKGFGASPSVGMPSPVDDRQVATARMAANAQIAAVNSQTALNSAQADYVRAQTATEQNRPALVSAQTATEKWGPENRKWATELLSAQFNKTLAEKDAILGWQRLMTEAQTKLSENQFQLLVHQIASAKTKAELDAKLSELERIVAMGSEAVGALTGGIGNVVRSITSAKSAKQLGRETFEETSSQSGDGWSQSYKRRGYKK